MSDDITTDATTAPTQPIPVAETPAQFPTPGAAYPQGAPVAPAAATVAASNKRIFTIIAAVALVAILTMGVFASGIAVGAHMGGPRGGDFGGPGRAQMQQGRGMMPGQDLPGGGKGRGMRGGQGGFDGQPNQNRQGDRALPQDAPTAPQAAPTPGQ